VGKCRTCGNDAGFMGYECESCTTARYGRIPELEASRTSPAVAERAREMAQNDRRDRIEAVTLTTAPDLAGHRIRRTIGIVTAECVYGLNFFRDFFAGLTDVFGGRSEATQRALRDAREKCLLELRTEAFERGGNAVIA
jgi:uncharacterized protein YbjQ (UPF0145 family)